MPDLKPTVLIVDDELSVRRSLSVLLKRIGTVITAASAEEAFQQIKENDVDLVLLDIRLPRVDGMEVLKRIKKTNEDLMVIMITAVKDARTAVEAMKLGAYDYITKPFNIPELRVLVTKALEKRALIKENLFLYSELSKLNEYDELTGKSVKMKQVFKLIDKAASSSGTVIIYGETGVGKELVARVIHLRSRRGKKPFIVINCAAIPEHLLESELFGHEAGAFTGATERKEGKFEAANGGSIFLDEIGSMSLGLQAKILRALQEKKDGTKEIERVGSSKSIPVDVRVIAATNKDLKVAIAEGKFREDLYYRLNVFPINVPPLRNRKEDIPLFINYFVEKYNKRLNKRITGVTEQVLDALLSYPWPGNVRELKNIIERLVTLKPDGYISIEELPVEIVVSRNLLSSAESDADISLIVAREQLERQFIKRALEKTGGNQLKAAKLLGMHRNTLFAKLNQLGLKKTLPKIYAFAE